MQIILADEVVAADISQVSINQNEGVTAFCGGRSCRGNMNVQNTEARNVFTERSEHGPLRPVRSRGGKRRSDIGVLISQSFGAVAIGRQALNWARYVTQDSTTT